MRDHTVRPTIPSRKPKSAVIVKMAESHGGRPLRMSHLWMGRTVRTSVSAKKAGPNKLLTSCSPMQPNVAREKTMSAFIPAGRVRPWSCAECSARTLRAVDSTFPPDPPSASADFDGSCSGEAVWEPGKGSSSCEAI